LLGRAYSELSRYDSALYFYQLSLKTDSNNLRKLSATGQTLSALGRYNEAIRIYRTIFQRDSSSLKSRLQLANLYLVLDRFNEAKEHYEYLSDLDSSNYFYFKQLGRCYQELGDTNLAIDRYLKAHNLNGYDLAVVSRLINLYLQKRDFDNGITLANEGLAIDAINTDLRKQRAYLYYLTGQYNLAIQDFSRVATAGDSSKFTLKYHGLCYYEEKFYREACMDLYKAYIKDTLDAETCFFLGLSCRWSGEEEEGVKYLNKTIHLLNPDPRQISRIYIELAGVYQVLHLFDKTLESYQKALEYSRNKDIIYFRIAQVYEENLKNKKMAIEYYQKFLDTRTLEYQLYDPAAETMSPVLESVQNKINRLKEELFFEE
jgi:tetratricopeptide (TPR) repeat protein